MSKIFQSKFNIILLILWLFITLITMFHHEIWRDEAQAWCLVRDLNFLDIFKASRIEGHPVLWYLILFPFAKFHFSVFSMQIISLILVFLSVCLFLFKSSFSNWFKFFVVFSAGLVYYLPVIARNYALVPVFLFALAYIYPKRSDKPYIFTCILILLANTHLLMFGFCSVVSLIFIIEQILEFKKSKKIFLLIPPVLIIMNNLFLIFNFLSTSQVNSSVNNYNSFAKTPYDMIIDFSDMFYNNFPLFNNVTGAVIFYIIIGLLAFYLYKYSKKMFTVMVISFGWFLYIYCYIWFGGIQYQKAFLFLLILLFCFWNCDNEKYKTYAQKIMGILFIISFLVGITAVMADINFNFSCSKQTAEFIKNNLKEEKVFLFNGKDYAVSPLSAYLPDKKFYSVNNGNYLTWLNFSNLENTDKIDIPQNARYLILQEAQNDISNQKGGALIFSSEEKFFRNKENYSIYDLNLL